MCVHSIHNNAVTSVQCNHALLMPTPKERPINCDLKARSQISSLCTKQTAQQRLVAMVKHHWVDLQCMMLARSLLSL